MTTKLFLGFDPGGEHKSAKCKGHFGWSICYENGNDCLMRLKTGLAKDAWDAITQVKGKIRNRYPEDNFLVLAAGIDSPLLWNKKGNKMGYRRADCVLRKVVSDDDVKRRVVVPNGLYGAVGMQGPLLARHLRQEWDLMITESHPTVFRHLLSCVNQCQLEKTANCLVKSLPSRRKCECGHERDATFAAIAAWTALRQPQLPDGNWQNLYCKDPNLFNPSGIEVSYWMPIPRHC